MLLGDEAVALGALHAGIRAAFSYPGTPATEILEFIASHSSSGSFEPGPRQGASNHRPFACWSTNEKVAYEQALGVSYAGQRSLVSMKHVGLNVAADAFMNSALTGAHGGLVLAVADDPGMHSSQNEQDSRYYAHFAKLPVYEPTDQQEAYDMTLAAFADSERLGLPVMIRLVTRLAHSRAEVRTRPEAEAAPALGLAKDPRAWTLLPVNARRQFRTLLNKYDGLAEAAEDSPYNELYLAGRRGILCAGIAYNYVREYLEPQTTGPEVDRRNGGEAYVRRPGRTSSASISSTVDSGVGRYGPEDDVSILRIGHYPLPAGLIRRLIDRCDEVLIVEDGYPFIEEQIGGLLGLARGKLRGRFTGHLPRTGELTPDLVRQAMGLPAPPALKPLEDLAGRPPQLCQGCPHIDSYYHIVEALKPYEEAVLFSDIGCYTLGALPPYNAIRSCVEMGASIGMARGAALAGVHPACCAIGDSTFVHSGMTGLVEAAQDDTPMTVFILDNATVAMTGGQETLATGEQLVRLVVGLGVNPDHVQVIEPLSKYHEGNVRIIRREIDHAGLSVVISKRACIHVKRK